MLLIFQNYMGRESDAEIVRKEMAVAEPTVSTSSGASSITSERFRKVHGCEPGPALTGDLMFCHADPGKAKDIAMEYMQNYFLTIIMIVNYGGMVVEWAMDSSRLFSQGCCRSCGSGEGCRSRRRRGSRGRRI